jgi:hypothetical protein
MKLVAQRTVEGAWKAFGEQRMVKSKIENHQVGR